MRKNVIKKVKSFRYAILTYNPASKSTEESEVISFSASDSKEKLISKLRKETGKNVIDCELIAIEETAYCMPLSDFISNSVAVTKEVDLRSEEGEE